MLVRMRVTLDIIMQQASGGIHIKSQETGNNSKQNSSTPPGQCG